MSEIIDGASAGSPYAPPKSRLGMGADRPPLPIWNPNAAANWCLLFSPIFGACLHRLNWIALGEESRARNSTLWLIAAVVMTVAGLFLGSLPPFLFLIVWYYAAARGQARYVKERYGTDYPRRAWLPPLAIALGVVVLVIFIFGLIRFFVSLRFR